MQQSTNISHPLQQQTHCSRVRWVTDGTDRQTDDWLLDRPCSTYYASVVNKQVRSVNVRSFDFDFITPSPTVKPSGQHWQTNRTHVSVYQSCCRAKHPPRIPANTIDCRGFFAEHELSYWTPVRNCQATFTGRIRWELNEHYARSGHKGSKTNYFRFGHFYNIT